MKILNKIIVPLIILDLIWIAVTAFILYRHNW